MLYLNSSYFLIDGVSLFPDHEDRRKYYFLPMMPHLTMVRDASGKVLPQIQLIEYEGAAGTGGFINFDVNLGVDPDKLTEVAAKLKRQVGLADDPLLMPVQFVDGTVKLFILGTQSPDQAAAAKPPAGAVSATGQPDGPRFVIKIQNAAKPSLFNENQATFSVQLDQYGATVLEKTLQGSNMIPIAVVYSLDFIGLRPAFNVHLHIDWDRVHSYMDEHFTGGFLFFSADVDKAVDKLIEDRVITLNVDTFIPDADQGKDVSSDRSRAIGQVYDMIKDRFFEPTIPPRGGDDSAAGTIEDLRTIGSLVQTHGVGMCSRKELDLTQVDKKTLDVNISERTAVQRTIYPQAHLGGLFDVLKTTGVDVERFIIKVDLDNPWFQRRKLNVTTKANFDADGIASIDVDLSYNGNVKSVTLTKETPQAAVEWSSLVKDGTMVRPVTYSYTVNFRGDVDTTQRPSQLSTPQTTAVGDALDIEPRADLYAITVIPIRADNLPWDRYPNVEVECRYADPANSLKQMASVLLTAQAPETFWTIFIRDRTKRAFEYRLSYALATGGTKVTPWTSTDDGKIDITDPYPAKVTLTVLAAVDWTVASQVLVYLAYPNKENPTAHQNFILNSQSGAQTFLAERQQNGQDTIYYEVRIIGQRGRVWTVPGSVTSDNYLIIQDGMRGHNIVIVKPEPIDFASRHVSEIDVQLRYVDARNSLTAAKSVKLAQASDSQEFAFDYLDPSVVAEYRADIQLDNGQTKSLDWAPVGGSSVTIPLSQLD
jgi:hypothetical protein